MVGEAEFDFMSLIRTCRLVIRSRCLMILASLFTARVWACTSTVSPLFGLPAGIGFPGIPSSRLGGSFSGVASLGVSGAEDCREVLGFAPIGGGLGF